MRNRGTQKGKSCYWFALVTTFIMSLLPCQAQTKDNTLRGIADINILIENPNTQASECEINKKTIRAAILDAVSQSTLRIVDNSPTTLCVNLNVMPTIHSCLTDLKATVFFRRVTMSDAGWQRVEAVTLWTRSSLRVTDTGRYSQDIVERIGELSKEFVSDWNAHNKSSTTYSEELENDKNDESDANKVGADLGGAGE